jgi:DNA-binding transcriptional MerR regulator
LAIAKDDAKNFPVLWTVKEISRHYGVHPSSVFRWDRENLLPHPVKDFGSRRWLASEVIEALKNVNVKRMRSEESDD